MDKRIDDTVHQFERRNATLQDNYKRAISDLNRNNEVKNLDESLSHFCSFSFQSIEQSVAKRFDDKYQRTMANLEKLKKEMRTCFDSLEGSVKSLQRITDGRIKVTEEKLDKEVEKIRSAVVLI